MSKILSEDEFEKIVYKYLPAGLDEKLISDRRALNAIVEAADKYFKYRCIICGHKNACNIEPLDDGVSKVEGYTCEIYKIKKLMEGATK